MIIANTLEICKCFFAEVFLEFLLGGGPLLCFSLSLGGALWLDGDVLNIPLFMADEADRLIGLALER